MKSLTESALRSDGKHVSILPFLPGFFRKAASVFCGLTLASLLVTGCKKESMHSEAEEVSDITSSAATHKGQVVNQYTGLPDQTQWELQQVRAATARYRHLANALKDGYSNINVVIPNMGHHYMKSSLVDATFDIRHPEILVYNPNEQGEYELVAAEYAIPLGLSEMAPEGFTGSQDVWSRNTVFGLWLLHAWVWAYNPDGVFNPTNPSVHVD